MDLGSIKLEKHWVVNVLAFVYKWENLFLFKKLPRKNALGKKSGFIHLYLYPMSQNQDSQLTDEIL